MPRNSTGAYQLPPIVNPVTTDTLITSLWANTTLQDVATALSDSLDRYGRGGMLAPFKNADGTQAAPGVTFTNETTSGLYRASTGQVGASVLGTLVMQLLQDQVNFKVIPTSDVDPSSPAHLVRKSFADTTYFPIAGGSFTGAPRWVNGATVLDDELVNKSYVTALAFQTALPNSATQPRGSRLVIDPAGVVAWSMEPAENEALGVLNTLGAF